MIPHCKYLLSYPRCDSAYLRRYIHAYSFHIYMFFYISRYVYLGMCIIYIYKYVMHTFRIYSHNMFFCYRPSAAMVIFFLGPGWCGISWGTWLYRLLVPPGESEGTMWNDGIRRKSRPEIWHGMKSMELFYLQKVLFPNDAWCWNIYQQKNPKITQM